MAQALPRALAEELDFLNIKESDGNSNSSSDEDENVSPCIDQEFSYDVQKEKLIQIQVTTIVNPNRLIVRLMERDEPKTSSSVSNDKYYVSLAEIFNEFKWKEQAALDAVVDLDKLENATYELYSKNKYVIVKTSTWDNPLEFDEGDSEDDDDHIPKPIEPFFSTGIVLSFSPNEMTYQVFLCDLGLISTCTGFDMTPIPPDSEFLMKNPNYALVTIPGIVPRKRMENIPGLATINFQDREWNNGAREDVQNWLSQYKVILLHKLIEESPCLIYGDFYGANDTETKKVHKNDLLTSYLTSHKNVFFNYQLLNRIYETKD